MCRGFSTIALSLVSCFRSKNVCLRDVGGFEFGWMTPFYEPHSKFSPCTSLCYVQRASCENKNSPLIEIICKNAGQTKNKSIKEDDESSESGNVQAEVNADLHGGAV